MESIFLLNGLLTLGIFIFILIQFIRKIKDESFRKIMILFMLAGFIYLVFSVFSFLWLFKILEFSGQDFPWIYSILMLLQTIILIYFVYEIKKNKKVFAILLFYFAAFSTIFVPISFTSFILITSFLITLLAFLLLMSLPHFEKITNLGIIYASLLTVFQIISISNPSLLFIFSFFSNLIFLTLVFFFIETIKDFPDIFFSVQKNDEKNSIMIDFLKYFIFIVVLTNFIFVGTISIHEVGHLVSGKVLGCEFGKIVYEDGGLPRTEVLCGNDSLPNQKFVVLGGIFLPIFLSLLLIFAGGYFIKETALLVLGFNFIISYRDLLDLGFSQNIPIFLSIIGGALLIFGIILLAKSRTAEEGFISLG